MSIDSLITLFFVAMFAGWVDAIAGGGGLITIPALMLSGVPPALAITTNKLQATCGSLSATLYHVRRCTFSLGENLLPVFLICICSVLGGVTLMRINASYLVFLVPVLLILIGIYFLFFAGNLDEHRAARISQTRFNMIVAPVLGFYDGFFGPGTGSFMAASLVMLSGFPIRKATAHAKLFNFVSNFSVLVYFILFGQIAWLIGGAMMGGQLLGAWLGAHMAWKAGAKIIRPMTIIVCFVMSARVLWQWLA